MSDLAEAILDTFHSDISLIWDARGTSRATATFEIDGSLVDVAFRETAPNDWYVSYVVGATTSKSAMECLSDFLRIVVGVLQAVREFLEIRQPVYLCIAAENGDLCELFEAYLGRQDTDLNRMGYGRLAVLVSPQTLLLIEKTTPSAWRDC